MIRLLIAIVGAFGACVLPYHVRILWQNWSTSPEITFASQLATPLTLLLYYTNSALNPILYALMSNNFRTSLKETVVTCWRKGRGGERGGQMGGRAAGGRHFGRAGTRI